ncbi:hypothetical protein AYO38_06970 [bacterium SCGC AG-212-C10]|nr:hypothetical protein AYO38_06970 [bacterium SCGC AG-212-C10]
MLYRLFPIVAVVLAIALFIVAAPASPGEAAPSTLPYRLFVPLAASDGVYQPGPVPGGDVPPPDPGYCAPNTSAGAPPFPPNTVLGYLTIGGVNAPVGTLVQLAFDGRVGPGVRLKEAGGYRVDWNAGGANCINKVGAALTVLVNGAPYSNGAIVGSFENPLIFHLHIP